MKNSAPSYTNKIIYLGIIFTMLFMYEDQFQPLSSSLILSQIPEHENIRSSSMNCAFWFEPNTGQTHKSVKFLSRGPNYSLFLTSSKAVLALSNSEYSNRKEDNPIEKKRISNSGHTVSIEILGCSKESKIEGKNRKSGNTHYLIGNKPGKWKRNVPHYEMVKYNNIYDGIDLLYHFRKGNLEYDFIVNPGVDSRKINFRINGFDSMEMDNKGNIILNTSVCDVKIKAPITYQEINGIRKYISSEFSVSQNGNIGFRIGNYDPNIPLIIDPDVVFSSYLGGSDQDTALGIDSDNDGYAYITGFSASPDFPAGEGSITFNGETDVFVTKLNIKTSEVEFTTFIGGGSYDDGYNIGIDKDKFITVAGWTCSYNFPTKNEIQKYIGDNVREDPERGDVFVLRLTPDGSSLVYSTYLGGNEEENLFDAVFDDDGNIYISGYTEGYLNADQSGIITEYPVFPESYLEKIKQWFNAFFVTKIDKAGELQYSALFETAMVRSNCLAVNNEGNAFLLRWAPWYNYNLPRSFHSIVKLNTEGTAIIDSISFTLSQDTIWNWTYDFKLDNEENINICGKVEGPILTASWNAFQSSYSGNTDGFIIKTDPTAKEFLYSTYLGGSEYDAAKNIEIESNGCIVVTGITGSSDFPVKDAFQTLYADGGDVWFCRIDPNEIGDASLNYSTFLGGGFYDTPSDIAIDDNGKIYISGRTWSEDYPLVMPLQNELPGPNSGFITVFFEDTIDLIYDKVVILGPRIFTPLLQPNTQQVLPQYLIKKDCDTVYFRFQGRSTDSRVGLRVTNTLVNIQPPLILDLEVIDPEGTVIPTWTIHNIGEGNRGVQFDVTKNGFYIIKVWTEETWGPIPAPFQIHLAGNVGWPQPLLFPMPDPPPGGIPDTIRATRQDILINAPAPRPQLVRGRLGQILYDPLVEVSQTSLFKFVNIFQVSEHAVAVLTPFHPEGFVPGFPPIRMVDPNPMLDITTPTAPFNSTVFFPAGGYVVDFTQVPIPAAIRVPVQLRHAACLGKSDGLSASLPVTIPARNGWINTPTLILDMGSGQEIVNGEGNDFRIISPEGNYHIGVSNTFFGHTFIPIGNVFSGDQEFDLNGTGLHSARYVRVIAEPNALIDAVKALNYFCDEIRTDIGPISKVSYVSLLAQRSKAPQTLFDPLIELIGPDGAINATNESGFGDDLSQNSSDAAILNIELNQEGFYRYLGRGHDKVPNEESFGFFYTRYESAGNYDQNEIELIEGVETDITAQRKVKIEQKRQRDSYLFQAAPNQIVNISVASSEIDVMLELYDPEGFMIAASDNHPGRGSNALISVQLPDSSFVGQASLPPLNTYRVVVSAIDQPGTKKSAHEGNAYIREPAIGEYEMKVFSSDEIIDIKETTDLQFDLHNLFPNPFSEKVAINFEIPKDEKVIIEIYDMQGRLVRKLLNEIYPPGKHCVYWKGTDDSGYRVLPGVYFCHFKAGKYNISKSIVYYQ